MQAWFIMIDYSLTTALNDQNNYQTIKFTSIMIKLQIEMDIQHQWDINNLVRWMIQKESLQNFIVCFKTSKKWFSSGTELLKMIGLLEVYTKKTVTVMYNDWLNLLLKFKNTHIIQKSYTFKEM